MNTDDQRYAAIERRDPEANFFYAVTTTGVFCKPSCAARLAKRENVRFYASTDDAAAAGYRPCKRCKPTEGDAHANLVARVCAVIDADDAVPSLDAIADAVEMSPYHLHR